MCCNRASPAHQASPLPSYGSSVTSQQWQSNPRDPARRPASEPTRRHLPDQPGSPCNPEPPRRSSAGVPYMNPRPLDPQGCTHSSPTCPCRRIVRARKCAAMNSATGPPRSWSGSPGTQAGWPRWPSSSLPLSSSRSCRRTPWRHDAIGRDQRPQGPSPRSWRHRER